MEHQAVDARQTLGKFRHYLSVADRRLRCPVRGRALSCAQVILLADFAERSSSDERYRQQEYALDATWAEGFPTGIGFAESGSKIATLPDTMGRLGFFSEKESLANRVLTPHTGPTCRSYLSMYGFSMIRVAGCPNHASVLPCSFPRSFGGSCWFPDTGHRMPWCHSHPIELRKRLAYHKLWRRRQIVSGPKRIRSARKTDNSCSSAPNAPPDGVYIRRGPL